MGGKGVISVVANIIPKDVVALTDAIQKGDKGKAKALHEKMLPLVNAMFVETNPIPVKKACELMGLCGGELRLPLCDMEDANYKKLKTALSDYGLLKEKANV